MFCGLEFKNLIVFHLYHANPFSIEVYRSEHLYRQVAFMECRGNRVTRECGGAKIGFVRVQAAVMGRHRLAVDANRWAESQTEAGSFECLERVAFSEGIQIH